VEAVAETSAPTPARTLGQTLAAERERQGLSRADVAQRLHMSAYQVEAIETGDYTRLPQGTFLRGFVRNYAKVLGIASDPLLELLAEGVSPRQRPGIVVPTESIRFDPTGEGLRNPYVKAAGIAFVVIALAFAAMYWWLFIRPAPPGAAAQKPAPATMVASAPQVYMSPAPTIERSPEPADVEVARQIQPEAAKKAPEAAKKAPEAAKKPPEPPKASAVEAPKPAPAVVNAAQGSTLKFVFKGQSWVEVRDNKGKLLFSRLNPAGSDAEVSGKPPFNVVVGNAPEVQLYYNDHEFDLEPHTKVAVARFTVE
jgi:cytoskeleton protein RodZ